MREVKKNTKGRYLARTLSYPALLLETVLVSAACAVLALTVNAVRAEGISLIQKTEYEILVPCPETTGEVETLSPDVVRGASRAARVIDARPKADFETWHVPQARSVPYDYLEPVSGATLRDIASSGAKRVIVYGDGADPDCGEHLARELAGKGIKNVGFIKGGAPALMGSSREGGRP